MIYLMRHGQDDETYIGGWSSVDLLPEGREEVLESATWLKNKLKIKRILSSDILRAVSSAEIVSRVLGLPYEKTETLREQDKGLLNGLPKDQAYSKYPNFRDDKLTVDTVYPNGESLRNLYERTLVFLPELLSLEDDTLLITHRGVINMVYYILNNQPLDMDKKQFGVTTASVHELNQNKMLIKKVR